MIIDLILDRKDGEQYNAKDFYNRVMEYQNITPDASNAIGDALDGGLNQDVAYQLVKYTIDNGYDNIDGDICKYINSQNWLDADNLELTRVIDAGGSSWANGSI